MALDRSLLSPSAFAVFFIVALFVSPQFLVTTKAADASYPLCPRTGKPPTRPAVPPTRCLSASSLSCCGTCEDFVLSLQQNAVNATKLLIALAPSLVPQLTNSVLGKDYQSCDVTGKYTEGQFIVEQFICAITCNPDSGVYFKLAPRAIATVCKNVSTAFYAGVKDVEFPGFPGKLGDFVQSTETFTRQLFQGFAESVGIVNMQIDFVDPSVRPCWDMKDRPLPETAGCCDPFLVPEKCPADLVNVTANPGFEKVLNRSIPSFCYPAPPPAPPSIANATGGTSNASDTKSAASSYSLGSSHGAVRGRAVVAFAAAAFAQLGGSFLLVPVVASALSLSSSSLVMWAAVSMVVSWLLLSPV